MQPGSFWTKKQFNADISGECASQLVEGKQTIAAQRWTFPTLRVTSLYCAKPFTLTFYRQTKLHNGWHLWSHGSKGWMKVPRPSNTHQKVSLIASRKRKSLNIARRSFGLFRLTILLWVLPAFLFDGTNLKEVTLVLTRVFKGELWAGFIPLTLIWKFSLVVKKKQHKLNVGLNNDDEQCCNLLLSWGRTCWRRDSTCSTFSLCCNCCNDFIVNSVISVQHRRLMKQRIERASVKDPAVLR